MFIHDKNDLKRYVIKYIICLIPLYIYGFYKNGILLYINDYTNIFGMFKIFYLVILSVLAYFLTNKILKKEFKFDLVFLSLFLVPLFCPYDINLPLYFIVFFLSLLIRKIYIPAFVIVLLSLFGVFNSSIDNLDIYAFSIWDYLWGRNIAGVGSSSILLGLIIAAVLSFINNYKYLISLSGLFSFAFFCILFKDYTFLLNGNAILTILFIATFSNLSPYLKKYMVLYGLSIGILGFFLVKYINPYYGMALSVLFISIIYKYLVLKKFNI